MTIKEFKEFVNSKIVKKQHPNNERAENLIKESERKFKSMNLILDKIGLNEDNSNDIIENCYDIIIYLIRAKMLYEGFNASGRCAHEAEVSYLKTLNFSNIDLEFMNKLRYFRNGIMYYGRRFDKEYGKMVLEFLNKSRDKLNKLLDIR